MPSPRRLKATALLLFLTTLIILYVTRGASNTQASPFYTRTVEAIKTRQADEARDALVAEEAQRMERVRRIEREHEVAVSAEEEGAGGKKDAGSGGFAGEERSVAGRKMMGGAGSGKVVVNQRGSGDDGVAKVGNVGPRASKAVMGAKEEDDETEEEHRIEEEMNAILKKGPVIVFSKSFCPHSKKAKHILLDLYDITPPPYVVELDQHELGPGLQSALQRSTSRRTVPNVLINGKSIGGGDEVLALHTTGKLAETVAEMGGKRVMSVEPVKQDEEEAPRVQKRQVKFRS